MHYAVIIIYSESWYNGKEMVICMVQDFRSWGTCTPGLWVLYFAYLKGLSTFTVQLQQINFET